MSYIEKILSPAQMRARRDELGTQGKSLVQCHGCFDIVHPGHIRYLRFARSQGDALVVTVTADRHVGKGYDRPLINQDLRAENLAALEFVDYVVLSDHPTAMEMLEVIRPDVYIKGKEYETSQDVRFLKERQLVEDHGGRVIFSSGDVVFSSTRLANFVRGLPDIERDRIAFFLRHYGVDTANLGEALDRVAGARFVVLGDPIIDRYVHCEEFTIASEQPIPSVTPIERFDYAGGAALIAGQLAALGAEVDLVTTVSASSELAPLFRELVSEMGVTLHTVDLDVRPVFLKTRYLVDEQKVFKINEGRHTPLSAMGAERMSELLASRLEGASALIVTDFGYGLFSAGLIDRICQVCERTGVPYVADVSGAGTTNLLKFRGARLVTPTEDELRRAFGDFESGLTNLCSRLYQATDAELAILTMGKRGALMLARENDSPTLAADYLPALSNRPLDVVGAGDVFLSALTASIMTGSSPQLGMFLGSALSACHIHRVGNAPSSRAELDEHLSYLFTRLLNDPRDP